MSGLIQPAMSFIGNINYVLVAVVGALRVASGQLSLGDVQAFIQYSRQFTQPLTQVASMANLLQSGVASAERVFALLDEPTSRRRTVPMPPPSPWCRGRVDFEHVPFLTSPTYRSSKTCPCRRPGPDGGHRRADRGRQDDSGQPAHAFL